MQVVAKFTCTSVTPLDLGGGKKGAAVTFDALYGDGKGNETWSDATPQGHLRMILTHHDAIGAFQQGKAYRLTFAPA